MQKKSFKIGLKTLFNKKLYNLVLDKESGKNMLKFQQNKTTINQILLQKWLTNNSYTKKNCKAK